MVDLDSITVRRVIASGDGGVGRASTLIDRVRSLVREARVAQPELVAYRLHDVGLQGQRGELMVNLYFRR